MMESNTDSDQVNGKKAERKPQVCRWPLDYVAVVK